MTFPDVGYGMVENQEYVSVETPAVRFGYYRPGESSTFADESIPVTFNEYLPNGSSYTAWTSGSVPIDQGAYSVLAVRLHHIRKPGAQRRRIPQRSNPRQLGDLFCGSASRNRRRRSRWRNPRSCQEQTGS